MTLICTTQEIAMSTRLDLYGNSKQSMMMPDLNVKMTRLEEKYALQRIGDRFTNYTTRVNQLTDTNQKLESLLTNSKVRGARMTI